MHSPYTHPNKDTYPGIAILQDRLVLLPVEIRLVAMSEHARFLEAVTLNERNVALK